ncbi:hypothetical protein FXN63_22345 [Pigmentiphaga aceris]|uniref:Uncharacterized protein n=1 Tax=Pigmentiphaga aceris TaxID=1940612 RepID=A0A5C0B0X1_9BURK|nr:type III secretion system translocon subunit SctB [Pigmentiphaga aceris]QEI08268.1 hypothetical protein FXN63_22345 [Pigmentiphaga aceris]
MSMPINPSQTGPVYTPPGDTSQPIVQKGSVTPPPAIVLGEAERIKMATFTTGFQSEVPPPASDTPPYQSVNLDSTLAGIGEKEVMTDMYAVMALFQKMAQEQRNSAREVRGSEMQAQVNSLKNAAQEIKDAAYDRYVGAMIEGGMQIGGGLLNMAGGVKAGKVAAGGDQAGATAISGKYSGAAGVLTGIGTMAKASQDLKAADHDASKARYEADAKVHESGVQQANDLMQQMMDVIRDVRDKLGSIEQSRIETSRGMARNI